MIGPELFDFLRELEQNNDREWFKAHKKRYEAEVVDPVTDFIINMAPRVAAISPHITLIPAPMAAVAFAFIATRDFRKTRAPTKLMSDASSAMQRAKMPMHQAFMFILALAKFFSAAVSGDHKAKRCAIFVSVLSTDRPAGKKPSRASICAAINWSARPKGLMPTTR